MNEIIILVVPIILLSAILIVIFFTILKFIVGFFRTQKHSLKLNTRLCI